MTPFAKTCFGHLRYLFVLGLLIAAPGCQTPGGRLDPGTADFIKPGITTLDEVTKIFGEPTQTIVGKDRVLRFWRVIYWASRTSYPGSGTFGPSDTSHARGLSVLFDGQNRVVAKLYSSHDFQTVFGAGSVSVGSNAAKDPLARIKPHLTTQSEAMAMLGEPMMESLSLDGKRVLDWGYSRGDVIAGQTELHMLRLVLDPSGIVVEAREVNDH